MVVLTYYELSYFMPELEESCENFAPWNPAHRCMRYQWLMLWSISSRSNDTIL